MRRSVSPLGSCSLTISACTGIASCASPDIELGEAVSALSAPWLADFGYHAGGWRVDRHPRMTGDVNGDGIDDVVGFANDGVYVSLSNGDYLGQPNRLIQDFGYNQGWRVDRHPRMLADVNRDGRDDVIGFHESAVYVSISRETDFAPKTLWSTYWGYNTWGTLRRVMADVNADGCADVIGFGSNAVIVSLSNGSFSFGTQSAWRLYDFANNYGWNANHPRMVADVNGDRRGDVVGFKDDGVIVATASTAPPSDPNATGEFVYDSPPQWIGEFGYQAHAGAWSVARHPRMMGDVDGDGKQDVIGFSDDGPYVAISTGSDFFPSILWASEFGYYAGGWSVDYHPRVMGDMDGDGKQDVVGFANDGTYVALSMGDHFSL